jgi:hypothetical protein
MKILRKIWSAIITPFECFILGLEESREINEDGSWDKYWERKNRKAAAKAKSNVYKD